MKGYTSFSEGFLGPIAMGKKIGPQKTFDYKKGFEIIKDIIKKDPECCISLGLREDWNNTSGVIYEDGKIVARALMYLTSCWATPIINVWRDGQEEDEEIECWLQEEGLERPTVEWYLELQREVES